VFVAGLSLFLTINMAINVKTQVLLLEIDLDLDLDLNHDLVPLSTSSPNLYWPKNIAMLTLIRIFILKKYVAVL
jgi:hypothetical protein